MALSGKPDLEQLEKNKDVDGLVKALNSDARGRAAGALGRIGGPRAVEALIAALTSDVNDEYMHECAARALGSIGDPRAVEALIAALTVKASADKTKIVIEALAAIGDTRAVEPLIDILESGRYILSVSKALVKIGYAEVKDQVFDVLRTYGGKYLLDVANDGTTEDAEFLIMAGVDVDSRTRPSGGYTPLLIAAGRGRTKIVKMLLDAGADVNARGESNRTAYDLACDRGYEETAQLIHEYIDIRDL